MDHLMKISLLLVLILIIPTTVKINSQVLNSTVKDAKISKKNTGGYYTFIFLPDLQNMTSNYPEILSTMFRWIINNKTKNNIQAVISLGDLTNVASDTEFRTISSQFSKLDSADIINLPVIGNHDYDFSNPSSRSTVKFDTYFPVSKYYLKNWFGGAYNSSMSNSYIKIEIEGKKYLIMGLEIFPRDEVLRWAQTIINQNTDSEILIVTHSYLNSNGTRTASTDPYGSNAYSLGRDNDAIKLWNNFIKVNENIHYVFSGHQICSPTSAYSYDINNRGGLVNQFFFNHQCDANGGNGFLIIMNFSPIEQKINIKTYSPFLNSFDSSGEYVIPFILNDVYKTPLSSIFDLEQNYPNPFNSTTKIIYSIPQGGNVVLKVYGLLGEEIATLVNEYKNNGMHSAEFRSDGLPSGVYFYSLIYGNNIKTKKLLLLK
jgi:predicted phosphodiesterase